MEDLEVEAGAVQEAVAEASEQAPAEPAANEISLDENGELQVPDSFWGDLGEEEPAEAEAAPEPEPEKPEGPAAYTHEEVAEAFISGDIDPARIPPELTPYYQAIAARQQQALEAQRAQEYQQQLWLQQQAAQQPIQPPEVDYEKLATAAKELAVHRLGIKPEDYDEYDQRCIVATNIAANELMSRATAIRQQQMAEQQMQYMEAARQQQFLAGFQGLVAERAKGIDMAKLHQFADEWIGDLPSKKASVVDRIFKSGDLQRAGLVLDEMLKAYSAGGSTSTAARETPPQVMRAGNYEEPKAQPVDVSKLGEMSSEDLAAWLIANKYVA